MSLQQLPPKKRILFLIEFVAEIVTHSAEDERLKKLIKVERIKRKLVPEPPVDLSPIGKSIIFGFLGHHRSITPEISFSGCVSEFLLSDLFFMNFRTRFRLLKLKFSYFAGFCVSNLYYLQNREISIFQIAKTSSKVDKK